MVTTVGTETSIEKLVENLLHLEHDAIAAYDSAIDKLRDAESRTELARFRDDHRSHVETLAEMARELGLDPVLKGDAKQILTTGKVGLANMLGGDKAILSAMKTNEDDTVSAYESASRHPSAIERSKAFFAKALADERRHRLWMQERAQLLAA